MATKTYAEVEAKQNLLYILKCKRKKGFSEKQITHFERISVENLARKSQLEQSKFVDIVTKATVDTCSREQVLQHYNTTIRPTLANMTFINTNQSGLGNMAYILLKINDPVLTEEWFDYLNKHYPSNK
jgi:hypothetical protein